MKNNITLLAFLFLVPLLSFSQTEKHDALRLAYKVASKPQVTINNKYGNVLFVQWEKDSVVVEVDYTVRSNKPQTVDALFQMINFNHYGNQHHVQVSTNLQMNYNNLSSLLRTITAGSNTIRINYRVYIPFGAQIKVENKFGNIIMNNISAPVDVKLDNGNFSAGNIKGMLLLDMSYGNANIQSLQDANIEFGSGDLDIQKAKDIQINSKMSRVNISQVNKLTITSLRDKYYLGNVNIISGKSTFTFITISQMMENVLLSLKYGGVTMHGTSPHVTGINLSADFSNISINLNANLAADLQLTYNQGTNLILSSKAKMNARKAVPNAKNTFSSSGSIGESKINCKITIKNKEGQIQLTQL
jgi:hypothetical protein